MSTDIKHKEQVEHNEKLFSLIDRKEFPDWTVTIIFYCAVHCVEYLFFSINNVQHTENHKDRNELIYYDKRCEDFRKQYRNLYCLSRQSRYSCIMHDCDEVYEAEQAYYHIKDCTIG